MPELRDILASGDIVFVQIGLLQFSTAGPNDELKVLEIKDTLGNVGLTEPSITTFTGVAVEAITEGMVVWASASNVGIASNDNIGQVDTVAGIAMHDALGGADIEVITDGVFESTVFTIAGPGARFVGVGGAITDIPPVAPAAAFLLKIGTMVSAIELSVDIDRAVLLIEEINP